MQRREEDARDVAAREQVPEILRKTKLSTDGPTPEDYDYEDMHKANGSFDPAAEGGYDLPNEHAKNLEVAGFDVNTKKQTGAQYWGGSMEASIAHGWNGPDNSPENLVENGATTLSKSKYNTETGRPDSDIAPLADVYRGAEKQGARPEDVEIPGWPEEQKVAAQAVARSLNLTERDVGQIVDGTFDYAAAQSGITIPPLLEGDDFSAETVKKDAGWQADSQVIYDYQGKNLTQDNRFGDPSDHAMYEMASVLNSPTRSLSLIYEVETGIMPVEVASAYARQWARYNQMESLGLEVAANTILATATDPLNVGGFAAIARAAFKIPLQNAILSRFLNTLAGRVALGGAIGGTEGATFGGILGLAEEEIQSEATGEPINWDKIKESIYYTGAAGTAIGVGGVSAISAVRTGIKNWHKPMPRSMTPLTRQRGSLDLGWMKEEPSVPGINLSPMQYGVSNEAETFSRLTRKIETEFSSKVGAKPVNVRGLMDALEGGSWPQGGKAGAEDAGYAVAELKDSGFIDHLQGMLDDGKKTISKDEMLNFLYANQGRVNVDVATGAAGAGTPGHTMLPGAGHHLSPNPDFAEDVQLFGEAALELTEESIQGMRDRVSTQLAKQMYTFKKGESVPDNVEPLIKFGESFGRWFEAKTLAAKSTATGPLKPNVPDMPQSPLDLINSHHTYQKWHADITRYHRQKAQGKNPVHPGDPVPFNRPTYNVHDLEGRIINEEPHTSLHSVRLRRTQAGRQLASKLSLRQMVNVQAQINTDMLTQPLRFDFMKLGDKVENPAKYVEMRLFTPDNDTMKLDDIAAGRFGMPYDELTSKQRGWTHDIKNMMLKDTEGAYESAHYPSEMGRFAHVRANEYYTKKGEPIFFIEEMQTDRSKEYFAGKKTASGAPTSPQAKFENNWSDVAFREAIRYAKKNGYTKIAWPSNRMQVTKIENWPNKTLKDRALIESRRSIWGLYEKSLPKMSKKMGLPATKVTGYSDSAGTAALEGDVFMIDISDYTSKPTPLNGFAMTPAGGAALYGEEDE